MTMLYNDSQEAFRYVNHQLFETGKLREDTQATLTATVREANNVIIQILDNQAVSARSNRRGRRNRHHRRRRLARYVVENHRYSRNDRRRHRGGSTQTTSRSQRQLSNNFRRNRYRST